MIKLTVAIPVYERTSFFDEALQSAINQTEAVKIIVVDNASSHDYFKKGVENCGYKSISYFRNSENIGMYGNWNRCIELCDTEYVMILGDDDILHKDYAKAFYSVLIHKPDLRFYHCAFERFGEKWNEKQQLYKAPIGFHTGKELLENAVKYGVNINTNAMIFARNLYPSYQFEFPKWSYNQDWLFAYTAFAEGEGYGQKEVLMKLRVDPNGNAIIVGARAYLSTSFIYYRIAHILKKLGSSVWSKGIIKSKEVLINSLIDEKEDIIKEMVSNPENPFGNHLKMLLTEEWLNKKVFESKGLVKKILLTCMKVKRKIAFVVNV